MRSQFLSALRGAFLTGTFAASLSTIVKADENLTPRRELLKAEREMLIAALHAEASGDLTARDELLNQAAQVGRLPESKWHRGMILDEKKAWVTIDESIASASESQKLDLYESNRAAMEDSVEGNMQLAKWCLHNKLIEQARSHLSRVIELDSNHVQAKLLLGYRVIGDEWLTPEDIALFNRQTEAFSVSIAKYGKRVRAIADKFASSAPALQAAGVTQSEEMLNDDVIPAIEGVFNNKPELAKHAIDWLSKIDSVRSSHSLAKFALLHDKYEVRQYAIEKLAARPLYDYVPNLLKILESPISTTIVPLFDDRGLLAGYSQAFTQEKIDHTAVVTHNNQYRTAGIRSLGQDLLNRQLASVMESGDVNGIALQARVDTSDMVEENARIRTRNQRISDVLYQVGGAPNTTTPNELWNWWDTHNETSYQSYKPERYTSYYNEYDIPEPTPIRVSGECFVRGTPVVTQRGMKPIESIVAGDLVLSRDTESGELAWKPVLRRTTRPPETTRVIELETEKLQCTTGHLFWISGKGWQKCSELSAGDKIHGARRPSVIIAVTDADNEETYNLDVADFGTYFAGTSMVLSHDVKPRSANRSVVPGLKMVRTSSADNR